MSSIKKYDLEERLIEFAVSIVSFSENLPATRAGNHLGGQLLRSGTSPALNYGEAQAAESRNDFIHKIKVCLKELRETQVCLKILSKSILKESKETGVLIKESSELVAIFVKSVATAESNKRNKSL